MDTKNLGRILRPSYWVKGNRGDSIDDAGWVRALLRLNSLTTCAGTISFIFPKATAPLTTFSSGVCLWSSASLNHMQVSMRTMIVCRPPKLAVRVRRRPSYLALGDLRNRLCRSPMLWI